MAVIIRPISAFKMSLSFSSLSRGSLQLLARRITFAPHARALCVAANVSSNETSELPPKQTSFERRSRKLNDILQGYVREQKFDAVEEAFKVMEALVMPSGGELTTFSERSG